LREDIRIRQATKKDISAIDRIIAEWLNWRTPRKESIKRAIENKELLVADKNSELIGFIHCVTHEDIIDGGLNSFITCFYICPEFRNKGIGSELLDRAIKDGLDKGAIGIETSTASPIARRLYERLHFRQFKGNWTMGEVFLELDMEKYKRSSKKG
jgi:ribosomal protein S18 acetylase RimI-like enzyme